MRRAGVPWSSTPRVRKPRFKVLRLSALRGSFAVAKVVTSEPPASATKHIESSGWCSSHSPGVPRLFGASSSSGEAPSDTPRRSAVFAREPVGAAKYMSEVTTTISTSTDTSDCQRKMVSERGMRPPGTRPSGPSTMARMAGCSAEGVAICRAALPERPWAQMLPRPRKALAHTAR